MPLVEFEHAIGEDVLLLELGRPARVRAVSVSERGPEYQVTFRADGERKLLWVFPDEVEKYERNKVYCNVGLARPAAVSPESGPASDSGGCVPGDRVAQPDASAGLA